MPAKVFMDLHQAKLANFT